MTGSTKSYSEMLKGELLGVARRLGLTNLSRLRKDEIIDLIKRAIRKQEQSAKKATTKKATAKKATAKKVTAKTATSKKATAKKVTAKKVTAKKATAKKATAKKATAKKVTKTSASEGAASTKKTREKKAVTKKAEPTSKRTLSYRAPAEAPRRIDKPGSRGVARPLSAQADAVASKYSTSSSYKPEELQGVDEGLPDLPETYGDNRIVLLPRDPAWLFAYWNLTFEYKEAARAAGGKVLALRLYDVSEVDFDGTNANAAYEHECAEWARSWYLPVPAPGRDYIVEIGYRGGQEWFPLARSKRVSVPSDQPSTWVKTDFVTIGFDEDLRAVRGRLPKMEAPEEPPTALPVTSQTIYDDGELRIMVGGPFFNPSGVPSWPLFSHAVLAAVGGIPGSLGHLAGSLGQIPGSLGHLPGSLGHVPGSLGRLPGSLGHLGQLARHPGTQDPGGLGTELDGRVFAGRPLVLEDTAQPMLQAAVEMVISGRSYPGTELTVAGRNIPTGPDGAFSLRVSVPEGLRDLPIEARSIESGAVRRLVLRFGREVQSGAVGIQGEKPEP